MAKAVVEVLGADSSPLGLGFVVEGPLIVTCAHVVNAVLGREPRECAPPDSVTLEVRFPFAAGAPTLTAELRHWAPDPSGEFDSADLALLSIAEPLPDDIAPFDFPESDLLDNQPHVHLYGPVHGRRDGGLVSGTIVGPLPNGRLQLNQEVVGTFRAVPGFSGGPAWLVNQPDSVAGMLVAVAVSEDARDAYVVGIERLKALWPSDLAFPTRAGDDLEGIFVQTLLDSPDLTSVFVPAMGNVPFDRIFVAPFVVPYDAADGLLQDASEEETAVEAVSRSDRAVIVAGPGMGKTTLLKFLTRSLATDRTSGTLPVLISLSAYVSHHAQRDLLSFGLHDRYGAVLRREELEHLDDAARVWNREGRLLFVLDGLDEVAEDRRRPLLEEILRLKRFVLASRPLARMPLDQGRGTSFLLSPMNHASVVRFVRNWASGVPAGSFPAEAVLERLRTDPRLGDLARTPQLLGLICWLVGRGSHLLPHTRLDLVGKAVGELVHSAVERGGIAPEDVGRLGLRLRDFLRQLALERLESTDEASVRFTHEEFFEAAERFGGSKQAPKLTRLALRSGLVVSANGADDELQFLHLVFEEYLAAEALTRSPDLAAAVDRVKFQSDCEECLRMACGLLSASNDDAKLQVILGRILDESGEDIFRLNHRLAARCLSQVTDADRRLGPMVERVAHALLEGASEWWSRDTFTRAFGELRTPIARQVLVGALRDDDRFVRWAAAEGLGRMADPDSLPAIVEALSQEDWPPVIGSLIDALGFIGDLGALSEVTSRAESGSYQIRIAVGPALGRMGAIDALEALLDRPNDVIQDVVVKALRHLPPDLAERLRDGLARKGFKVWFTPENPYASAEPSLSQIDALLQSPDVGDHLRAVEALARRDDWAACQRLLELVTSEDEAVVQGAISGLMDMVDDHTALIEAVRALVVMMLDPGNAAADIDAYSLLRLWLSPEARAATEEAAPLIFEDAFDEAGLARLKVLIEAEDPNCRAAACWALAHVPDQAHDQLLRRLDDEDDIVRWVAAWSVAGRGHPEDAPLLLERLAAEGVVEIRATLAEALGLLQAKNAVPALIELLADEADDVREAAVTGLGRIGDGAAAPSVTTLLTDPSWSVRHATAMTLGWLQAEESASMMADLLGREEHPDVVIAYLDALGDLAHTQTEAMVSCLDADDEDVRIAALRALGRVGDDTVGQRLLEQLGREQSGEAIKAASRALGLVADEATVITAARQLLEDNRLSPLVDLVEAAAQHGDAQRMQSLRGVIASHGAEVTVAQHTVEITRGDETVVKLDNSRAADVDGESLSALDRWDAVHVWSEPEDDATLERLAARLRDEEPQVAKAAADVLDSLSDDPQHADGVWRAIGAETQAAIKAGEFEAMIGRLLDADIGAAYRIFVRPELLCPLLTEYRGGVEGLRPILWDIGWQFGIRMLPDGRTVTAAGEVHTCEDAVAAIQRSHGRT